MEIKVVNISKNKKYQKKNFKNKSELYIYCGRPSLLSNPYVIGKDGSREEVIEKFRVLANDKASTLNKDMRNFISFIKAKNPNTVTLGCYCKPLKCHCDVIEDFLDFHFNPRLF